MEIEEFFEDWEEEDWTEFIEEAEEDGEIEDWKKTVLIAKVTAAMKEMWS